MRARRNGSEWKKGQWGLFNHDDPAFIWNSTPVPSKDEMDLDFPPLDFDTGLNNPISVPKLTDSYELVKACFDAGYDQMQGEPLANWLFNHLGVYLKDAPMIEYGDAMPHLDQQDPTDYSIGRNPIESEKLNLKSKETLNVRSM
jgi:hypothetical protein